jgi:hypothetical protein
VRKLTVILALLLCIGFLVAQQTINFQSADNASAYTYSGSMNNVEKLKINTYIWGQIRQPGLYIVPDDTDLLKLLSLAGGPTEDAKLNKIRIIRPTNNGKKVIFVNLKKYIDTGDENLIPVLMPGDTIVVAGTIWYAVTRFTSFVADVAVLITVYATLSTLNK